MVIANDQYQSIGIVRLSVIRGIQRVTRNRSISFNLCIVPTLNIFFGFLTIFNTFILLNFFLFICMVPLTALSPYKGHLISSHNDDKYDNDDDNAHNNQ